MHQDAVEPVLEVKRLQRCMSDLVSVLALPASWSNSEPKRILETFLDALVRLLDLDVLYAQANVTSYEGPIEVLRVIEACGVSQDEVREALHPWLVEDAPDELPPVRMSLGDREVSIHALRLGIEGSLGVIVAGSQRPDFPQQTEHLVMSVAANQLAVMLQQAQLLSEQKRVAQELDERVAQQTRELATANEQLKENARESRLIVDNIPGLVALISATGDIDMANRRLLEYLGQTLEELKSWATNDTVHLEDRPHVIDVFSRSIATGNLYETQHRFNRWDGTYRWFQSRGIPLRDTDGTIVRWCALLTDLNDQKCAEEALRESEAFLLDVQQLSHTGSWRHDLASNAVSISPEISRIHAIAPHENATTAEFFFSRVHADDRPGILLSYTQAVHEKRGFVLDYRIVIPGGSIKYIRNAGHPKLSSAGEVIEFVGTTLDVTEQQLARVALQENERNLASIINTIPTTAWSTRPDGYCEFLSERWLSYAGMTSEEARGWAWASVIHPDDAQPLHEYWTSCLASGTPVDTEARMRRFDGVYRWFIFRASPLRDASGTIVRWYGTNIDIDDRKRAEEALTGTRAELAHVTRVTSLGVLTAPITHEVNQPLSGIITNANTCLRMLDSDSPNIEGARETARRTLRDGNRASEVITRLRTLFNKKEAIAESVDLNEATREVLALQLSEFHRQGIKLQRELADNLSLIEGDRIQLQQVILNLLRNASEAMSSIGNQSKQLIVRTEQDGDHVRLMVKDSGIGFEPPVIDRLFASFYTTKPEGMGIGLSVSRSIIEAHGGRLWATANDGPGATFAFRFPANAPIKLPK